ncbi:PREDICTED: rRNA biogenesis protein rrp36-like [Prunus mume]|uniref:rRNA biogenesis protein rrp36-like n=1 Tax=Prunus mume TaxID=102107 RepID=A0ABM0NYL9_PRUMU|nr:PREDICTED: rRNA biogenesis protein rrp36-like [Prunus mume]
MKAEETHVALKCIPLLKLSKLLVGEELTWLQQGTKCEIIFEFYDVTTPVKIFGGVHLFGHQVADVTVDRRKRQWLLPVAMAGDDDDDDDDDNDVDDDDDDQHQDNELPSLPSASETSLGKRPRRSDFKVLDDDHRANVLDVCDHEAQIGEADHPKRRHTDLNEEPKQ